MSKTFLPSHPQIVKKNSDRKGNVTINTTNFDQIDIG
jgi:hypothetical protein